MKRMATWSARLWRIVCDSGGAEIAEAAAVLPVVFTVIMAIFSFGRAYNVYSTITRAAQDGATVAASFTCGSCGNQPAAPADVATAVTAALQASRLNPANVANNTLSPAPTQCASGYAHDNASNIDIYRNVRLNPGAGPEECGTIVTFKYPYDLNIPFTSLSFSTITMTAAAERHTEN